MTEPKLDESGWFRKKNNVYFSFEDGQGNKNLMFASDHETIDTWIKEIKSAIKYHKWIMLIQREKEKIWDIKMVE